MVSTSASATAALELVPEAEQHLKAGDLVLAEERCRDALRQQPGLPDGLSLLGRTLFRQGHTDLGIALLRQAVTGNQHAAKLRRQLGKALLADGNPAEAMTYLTRANTLDPTSSATLHSLGEAFVALGQVDAAEATYRQAVSIEARDAQACYELINVLQLQGKQQEAEEVFKDAVALMPGFRRTHLLAARRLQHTQPEAARRILENGLALQPHDEELAFCLESLNGGAAFLRAPDRFVAAYFDDYAPTFDRHLLESLSYHAPELIAHELQQLFGTGDSSLTVLDMGCGTGLCGTFLRPLARRLVGVDLSSGMLAQARERHIYDDLISSELTAYLSDTAEPYELVIAADVLVYFGDLAPVFKELGRVLSRNGVFVASFERSDSEDYLLHSGGRYVHSEAYLRHVAAVHHLETVRLIACELRTEWTKPVDGYIAVFRNP